MPLTRVAVLSALVALGACADESRAPPVSSSPLNGAGTSLGPVDPNSLPPGAAVQAPLDPRAGNVNSVRVGPR